MKYYGAKLVKKAEKALLLRQNYVSDTAMTRRSLIIIIGLLAVIDIAAGLWYLTLRIEASGRGFELFHQDDEDVSLADTVSGTSVPDSFARRTMHAFYISESPAVRGNEQSHYTSVRTIDVRWPVSINGNDHPRALESQLIEAMFGSRHSTIEVASSLFLNTPQFNQQADVPYKTLQQRPTVAEVYGNEHKLMAFPVMTSDILLVMEVDEMVYDGHVRHESRHVVHYDRRQQRVIKMTDIIDGKDDVVLALINDKIDSLNERDSGLKLHHAYNVPREFAARRSGIIFLFPSGEIDDPADGPTEVLVPYPLIGSSLTSSFKKLLNDNGGYWNYKPITDE